MIIYKVTWNDAATGYGQHWEASEVKARSFRAKLKKEYAAQDELAKENPLETIKESLQGEPTIEKVEFPSGKKQILAWLNAHCYTGNA